MDRERNTAYYHAAIVLHGFINLSYWLRNDVGEWISDMQDILELATNFYYNLYTEDGGSTHCNPLSTFPSLQVPDEEYLN